MSIIEFYKKHHLSIFSVVYFLICEAIDFPFIWIIAALLLSFIMKIELYIFVIAQEEGNGCWTIKKRFFVFVMFIIKLF